MSNGWPKFKTYALSHGVHNGPATMAALYDHYETHKGSHYETIAALFLARGHIMQQQQFAREMGCAKCIKDQNAQMSGVCH